MKASYAGIRDRLSPDSTTFHPGYDSVKNIIKVDMNEICILTPVPDRPYTFGMDRQTSDEDLMIMYKQGDASAFDVLYTRHKGGVYRFVLRQCGNRSTTDELFQDIWMKLIQHRERYQVKAKFVTYLYTIARHRIIDYYRHNRDSGPGSGPVDIEGIEATQHGPDEMLALQQDTNRLLAGIASLPSEQREAILLKEEAGMSLQEIAELTGVNTETVKSRLRYAIKKLHQVMKV